MYSEHVQFWEDIGWITLLITHRRYVIAYDANILPPNFIMNPTHAVTCDMAYQLSNNTHYLLVLEDSICFTCWNILYVVNCDMRIQRYEYPHFVMLSGIHQNDELFDYTAAARLRYICRRLERYYQVLQM